MKYIVYYEVYRLLEKSCNLSKFCKKTWVYSFSRTGFFVSSLSDHHDESSLEKQMG